MIDVQLNNTTTTRKYNSDFFKYIIELAVKEVGTQNVELSINLVEEDRIKELNKKYRNKDKVTDVISFPLNKQIDSNSMIGGIISLGDIFICLSYAKKCAESEGVSLDSKLTFLTVHGFLHLLGYDHEHSESEKKKMFSLQNKIIDVIKNNIIH